MNEARIKLAEAMGYYQDTFAVDLTDGTKGFSNFKVWYSPVGVRFLPIQELPDPFTDANDDYAVLEWARSSWLTKNPPRPDKPEWDKFCGALFDNPKLYGSLLFYQIGDYARAACKVLDID